MAGIPPSRQRGALLVTVLPLLLLLNLLALGDMEEVQRQIRLGVIEQEIFKSKQLAINALDAKEQALAAEIPGISCLFDEPVGTDCGDVLYFPRENIDPAAAENCRPDFLWPLPWQVSSSWPAMPAAGAAPAMRSIVEFRCFLPSPSGLSPTSLPLYRVTILSVSRNSRLGLQSLWSPRGRHARRYLQR